MAEDILFTAMPVASWTVGGVRLSFPVLRITQSGGNRIILRERPYRDGAKLDDTGSLPITWEMTCLFENTIKESGLDPSTPLYPTVLNALLKSFDTHETGDLVVPTVGRQRARAQTYRREETFDEREAATLTLAFCEDNEDGVSARSFRAETASANARVLAEQTTFDAQSLGSWDQSLSDLERTVSEVGDLVNAPETTAAEVERKVERVRDLGRYSGDVLLRQDSVHERVRSERARRKVLRARGLAGRTRLASNSEGGAEIVSVVALAPTSLVDVSGQLGQPLADLLALNPGLDPLFVAKGDVIRVRAS